MSVSLSPLQRVFIKVLEDWALMLVDDAQDKSTILSVNERLYLSRVNIKGAINGTLSIVAPHSFLQILALNLLGLDNEVCSTQSELEDAFREMVNVLAGNLITEAYGDRIAVDVIVPEVLDISQSELELLLQTQQVTLAVADETPVCASFERGS